MRAPLDVMHALQTLRDESVHLTEPLRLARTSHGHLVHGAIDRIDAVDRRCRHVELSARGIRMNHDTIAGQWKQVSGKIKQQWGKLTDDDMKVVEGNADMLAGRLQERYGIARDEAERQVREFEEDLSMSIQKAPRRH
jgi:uncharacterized protein YjbJ (UPF0337 family)